MRNLLIVCTAVCLLSCGSREKQENVTSDFDFLLGDWERTNTKDGVITMEHWKIASASEYNGHGYTIEKKDTTFQEWMRLHKTDSLWRLEISGPNENPVIFTITDSNINSFKAKNPANEFPKRIEYSYFDETLTAHISNEELTIPFIFWRVE